MILKIKQSFPSNTAKWWTFTATSLPIICAAMIFALNSFIDNFMAIPIPGGIDKLAYANTWTSLVTGIIAATTIIGSSLFGQYYGAKDKVNTRYILRSRILIALLITSIFALPAFIAPELMINIVGSFKIEDGILEESSLYLRIIAVTWLTGAWGYTSAMIMREAGHGKASLISSIISLSFNVILNSIFVFGFKLGIWALGVSTIISQFFSVGFNVIFVWIKNKELIVNPLKLFLISKQIWKQIFKRSISFLLLVIGSVTVSIRFIFWNKVYYPGTVGGNEHFLISAATILGISGAIFNIFWSTFESIGANTTIFVGRELGHGNLEQAKINAKELQGFHFVMSLLMGTTLLIFSFIVPYMSFLTDGYEKGVRDELMSSSNQFNQEFTLAEATKFAKEGSLVYLEQLKITIWPLAGYMPMWVWYITRSRCISAGGNTNTTSLVNASGGIIQTCWISMLVFLIICKTGMSFPTAYALFFASDFIKIFVYEILFYKLNWGKNLTLEIKDPETISLESQNIKD